MNELEPARHSAGPAVPAGSPHQALRAGFALLLVVMVSLAQINLERSILNQHRRLSAMHYERESLQERRAAAAQTIAEAIPGVVNSTMHAAGGSAASRR